MKKVSLSDIAKASGVSISTVSRIINNSPGIAEKTRNHVLDVMKDLNYHPKHLADGKNARPSRLVTLVIAEHEENVFENPFFIMAIKGAHACVRDRHYHMMVSFCRDEHEQLSYLQELVPANWTDGVLLFSVEQNDPSIEYLQGHAFPFSMIGKPEDTARTLWVDNDNFQAIYQVVSSLVDSGKRSIAFIGTKWHRKYTIDRYEGFKQALRSRGIDSKKELCSPCDEDKERNTNLSAEDLGYQYMMDILEQEKPDAVIAIDDFLAFGVMKALKEKNLEHVSVIGFNNSVRARYQHPSLSSVDIHPEELGYQAAELLIDSLQNTAAEARHKIVDTTIIHRETSL
ncbi:MAG: LacI family transcriptional regulator [Spirochaetia bacterium]|nr:LacI family transcriptional regulator [Spirochaetia bacterium]